MNNYSNYLAVELPKIVNVAVTNIIVIKKVKIVYFIYSK